MNRNSLTTCQSKHLYVTVNLEIQLILCLVSDFVKTFLVTIRFLNMGYVLGDGDYDTKSTRRL